MADSQALLAALETEKDVARLRAVLEEIQKNLEPVFALGNGAQNITLLRPVARLHGPVVTSLVKLMHSQLSTELACGPEQLDVLGDAACLGLNALDCLRGVIKASQHELDLQRYNFVRKMATLGLYKHALAQGKLLHASVALGPEGVAGLADLHMASVLNLLMCYTQLAKADNSFAGSVWAEVSGPVEVLLQAARDAVAPCEAGKLLEPVLKCLSKVIESQQNPEILCSLSPHDVAQQLAAFVDCGAVCQQNLTVEQVLLDVVAGPVEALHERWVDALLDIVSNHGSLPGALCCVLHRLVLRLLQKRGARQSTENKWSSADPVVVLVRAALHLSTSMVDDQLAATLSRLSGAARELAAALNVAKRDECWLRWCGLDLLRVAIASMISPLVCNPQSAGGKLPALVHCMGLLCSYSSRLLDCSDGKRETEVVTSGCSAVTLAVRLQTAHCICTGHLAGFEEIPRTLEQLRQLLQRPPSLVNGGRQGALAPAVLQSLSASLSNTGIDLLQAQHVAPAVQLLQMAADMSIMRAEQLKASTASLSTTDALQLVKKCKAHVAALQQLNEHQCAMSQSAKYVVQLHEHVLDNVHPLSSLIKLYVRSGIVAADAVKATAASGTVLLQSAPSSPRAAASGGPVAPCKAQRKGGRLRHMQATAHAGANACAGQGSTEVHIDRKGSASAQTVVPSPMMQVLATAAQGKKAPSGLLDSLDIFAVYELEVLVEESKRLSEGDVFQQQYSDAILGALQSVLASPGSSAIGQARALLVSALAASSRSESALDYLRAACRLLDSHLATAEESPSGKRDSCISSVWDSAALVHAQLGACLAQEQLAQEASTDATEAMEHVVRAIELWGHLLNAKAGKDSSLFIRMPQATLHAVLQTQQLLHLYGSACAKPPRSGVVWKLVSALSDQVKLRDQDAYLLCATRPEVSCFTWALATEPQTTLACGLKASQGHSKLSEVLKLFDPIREAYEADHTNHAALASVAYTCAVEMERAGFLRHGPCPQLLRSQCHQVAAAAYLRAGDTVQAYAQAQSALRLTCALFAMLDCLPQHKASRSNVGGPMTKQVEMTPAEAAAAAVQAGAAASAADYTVDEADEHDEFALASRQIVCQEASSGSYADVLTPQPRRGVALGLAWAIAAAHLSSLHQAARVFEAAGCAEDAMCLWGECCRTAELFGVTDVQALCSIFLAELSCRRDDAEVAETHLDAAQGLLERIYVKGVSSLESGTSEEKHLLRGNICAARARLSILHHQPAEAEKESQSGLAVCEAMVKATASCETQRAHHSDPDADCVMRWRRNSLAWYATCLRSQLQRLHAEALQRLGRQEAAVGVLEKAVVHLREGAAGCSGLTACAVWPVDHGLLLAHQAAAVCSTIPCSSREAEIVGLRQSGGGTSTSKGRGDDLMDMADRAPCTDQSSKNGTKLKGRDGLLKGHQQPDLEGEHCMALTRPTDLRNLLLSLQLCWQVPLAAAYAIRCLIHVSMALGLSHAASMFLHLGQGMSFALQQALQVQPKTGSTPNSTCEAKLGDTAGGSVVTDSASSDVHELYRADVRGAALHLLMDLLKGTDPGDLLMALEQGAEGWLNNAMRLFPTGTVVCALVQDAGQLLLSRLSCGDAPLLVSLPRMGSSGPASIKIDAPDCSSAGDSLDRCSAKLRQVLEESCDSMRVDQTTATSQSHKAKWWKTRTSLDKGVKEVLQELSEECLGPWRCLLLPIPPSQCDILQAAAAGFVAEHFPAISCQQQSGYRNHTSRQLQQLLTITLCHMHHLQSADLPDLLRILCSFSGRPTDSSQLNSLATELAATEAAVRIQLMHLPSAVHSRSSSAGTIQEVDGSSCSDSSMSCESAAESAGVGRGATAGTAGCRAAGVAITTRARSLATRAPPQIASVVKVTVKDPGRQAGFDSDASTSSKLSLATGRAKQVPRLTALQQSQTSDVRSPRHTVRSSASTPRGPTAGTSALVDDSDEPSTARTSVTGTAVSTGPVLLLLSPGLHALPWESIPCYRKCEVYRILSLPVACNAISRRVHGVPASVCGSEQESQGSGSSGRMYAPGDGVSSALSAYYVLNPSGDLESTQRFFQPLLQAEPNWQGLVGESPSSRTLLAALQSHDLYVYIGHGSGEQLLPLAALRRLQRCAMCLLMGCSSGRLRLHGAYDPSGAAVAYLLAGCPALVANLWDITDRDIDRFCRALMESWLSCGGGDSSEVGSGDRHNSNKDRSCAALGSAMNSSRSVCKLSYLTGAAPVCYGVPLGR